ncbi:YceI family protein [Alteromonas aestuariivivens]|uniref:YceI family protein n=1 Tax=Alteromonas aestuariivivens TaxID=1938339 RepID=A0A3D8M5C8_9ALTE|nr:YceI family protein [Alteromonas aestuariivivens]RDV24866.1 YceI family protein [Alteromonas aestuariivivens]
MFLRTVLAVSGLCAMPALAAWQLDKSASSLHFLTTKNAQVTEIHQFTALNGSVSDSGQLSVEVPLASVNTSIEIRDTRMKELLFDVANFPVATFTAQVPESLLRTQAGQTLQGTVEGKLTLHGTAAPASFEVIVNRVDDDTLSVTTVSPTLVQAKDFALEEGVAALQKIAGLDSITLAVPVTFSVTFTR